MSKNVVLIYPLTGFDIGSAIVPPHSLLAISAFLHRDGYRIKIIDQRIDRNWRSTLIRALQQNPLVVGISCMTGTQIYHALEGAKLVRNTASDIPIVWGGPHPTILPHQTLENPYVDIVVRGEGDFTFYELVKALEKRTPLKEVKGISFKHNGNIFDTPERPLCSMDELLPVPWEPLRVEDYIHQDMYLKEGSRTLDIGQTSRGCPYNCGFCCSSAIRKHFWRPMSVESAIEQIVSAVQRFRLNGIWIRDDNFYVKPKRVVEICKGIINAGLDITWYSSGTRVDNFLSLDDEQLRILKKSGANVLKFGAESGSNRILKLMNKKITVEQTFQANLKAKEFGFIPAFSFIGGFPLETWEELLMTIRAMRKIKEDNPQAITESLCTYTALPGTPMFKLALENGLRPPTSLKGWISWNFQEAYIPERNPWLSEKHGKWLGNLTYMSALSNVVPELLSSIDSDLERMLIQIFFTPIAKFYGFRFKHEMYRFVPELKIIKFIRKIAIDRINV